MLREIGKSTPPSFIKRTGLNVALFAVSVMATLALIELFLIYFMPVYIHTITSKDYQLSLNPKIAYELKPLVKDHNADGIRSGADYTTEKPKDVFRAIVVGDSLAYGLGVKLNDTYAKRLEHRLNGHPPTDKRYEVINLGVPGYRITQIVERVKSKGLKYAPDLIVYGYWLDDIADSCSYHEMSLVGAANEESKLVLTEDISKQNLKNILTRFQLSRRIILFNRGLKHRESQKNNGAVSSRELAVKVKERLNPEVASLYLKYTAKLASGEIGDLRGFEPYYAWYGDFDKFAEWNHRLHELAELAKKHQAELLLLMTPVLYDHAGQAYNWGDLHEFVRAVAACYSIPVLDLKGIMGKYRPEEIGTGDYEHPNAAGNDIISEQLYQYLKLSK